MMIRVTFDAAKADHARRGEMRRGSRSGVAAGIAVLASFGASTAAIAQGADAAQSGAVALPPVIVEGATLAKPVAKAKPRVSAPAPVAAPPQAAPPQAAAPAASAAAPVVSLPADISDQPAAGEMRGFAIDTLGTSVGVVGGAEIEAQQTRYTADVLRSLPGVQVNRGGGPGGVTDVRIRGGEANHTLVLVDGIAVNDPTTGSFDFSNLLADDIERIEVIRGPQSGLYGSNALAGVVNVVTANGYRRPGASVKAHSEIGSYGTRDAGARVSASNGAAWFSLGHHWREVDAFDIAPAGNEDDPVRFNQFSLRAGIAPLEGLVVDFTLRKFTKSASRDGFDGPDGGMATAFDDASTFTSDLLATGLNIRWDSRDGAFTHLLRASRLASRVTDDDTTYFYRSDNEGTSDRLGYLATWRFDTFGLVRHSLTGLVEKQDDGFTPRSDFTDGRERQRGQLSFAGEWRGEFADRLALTGAVRHDDNDSFDDNTTWRASASLALGEFGLRPHASVGTGVKLPTMFEQFGFFGAFQPNPDLEPETSFGWDAGVELTLLGGRAVVDVTYFEQDLENKIRTTFTGAVNLPGIATRDGVEVALRWRVVDGVTVGGAYTLLDAIDANGTEEARRARHAGRFDVDYVFADGRARLNVAALYNGRARDDGFRVLAHDAFGFPLLQQVDVTLDPYWLVTVAGSYRITPQVELFGRIENALDVDYREQFSYATPGLAAYGGLRLRLDAPVEGAPWK